MSDPPSAPSGDEHHGHSHSHLHTHDEDLEVDATLRRWLNIVVVVIALACVFALVVLWPRGKAPSTLQGGVHFEYVDGTVLGVRTSTCPGIDTPVASACQLLSVKLTSGSHSGDTVVVTLVRTEQVYPTMHRGDEIDMVYNRLALKQFQYSFYDFDRTTPLLLLLGLFVVVVIAVGRWKGARALLGLAVSMVALLAFLVPSLIRGNNAIEIALAGTTLVAFAAMYLANGVNALTSVALIGTLAALVVTAVLVIVFVWLCHITGLVDQSEQVLRVTAAGVDLRGLVIAGTVLGALGVLDDVTITQVSVVGELRRANPSFDRFELYLRASRIGRDHIASTINTLVLAYAGAALPLLLTFDEGSAPFSRVLTSEVVATEIIRTLVGSIGLVMAVPITTALAAALVGQRRPFDEGSKSARWEDFAPDDVS